MKMKKVLALMMALAVVGTVGAPAITADAEGLTQATNPNEVNYGKIDESDLEILKSLFDVNYYIEQNPDIAYLLGNDYNKLFEHFTKCGIFEGRSCNPSFDPSAYASAYSDLKELFGSDIMMYYKHFATVGKAENRTLTTMEACANAGITVHPLTNETVNITPQVYRVAQRMGIKDINSVTSLAKAVDTASSNNGAVVITPVTPSDALEEAQKLEKVGAVTIGENSYYVYVSIGIAEGKSGYAAYLVQSGEEQIEAPKASTVPIYKTDDYVAPEFFSDDEYIRLLTNVGFSLSSLEDREYNYETSENKEYSMVDTPHYTATTKGSVATKGVNYSSNGKSTSTSTDYKDNTVIFKETVTNVVASTGNNPYTRTEVLDGYYTDNQGNWKPFSSDQEKYDYLDRTTVDTGDSTSWYSEGGTYTSYNDDKGNRNTVYDYGLDIKDEGDGKLTVKIGVYNEDNNFGAVTTYEVVTTTKITTANEDNNN